MIKVIDNLLSDTHFGMLQEVVLRTNFEWCYNNNITSSREEGDDWSFGYNHTLIESQTGRPLSQHYPAFLGLLCDIQDATGLDRCTRARLDMTTRTPFPYEHPVHIDSSRENLSCIFYMNESDGDTIMYNETTKDASAPVPEKLTERQRIEPKPNRLVIFDGFLEITNHLNSIVKPLLQ